MGYDINDTFDWLFLQRMNAHIDNGTSPRYHENPLAAAWGRIAKIGEEFGEVIEAFIGETGQNFRKQGVSTRADTMRELADVVVTATLAMMHLSGDPQAVKDILLARQFDLAERAGFHRNVGQD